MEPLRVRSIVFGEGRPKICVPIVATTREEIIRQALRLSEKSFEVCEWRMDYFEGASEYALVCDILRELRTILGEKLLLSTFRTKKEGGRRELSDEAYEELLCALIQSKASDIIDAELRVGDEAMRRIITNAHSSGVFVLASSHDFHRTPDKDEMIDRLLHMQQLGADLLKLAVMPLDARDVLALLAATEEMNRLQDIAPVITMSMGAAGVISRIAAETFGSAMTFATVGETSAPGQLPLEDMNYILNLLHT